MLMTINMEMQEKTLRVFDGNHFVRVALLGQFLSEEGTYQLQFLSFFFKIMTTYTGKCCFHSYTTTNTSKKVLEFNIISSPLQYEINDDKRGYAKERVKLLMTNKYMQKKDPI